MDLLPLLMLFGQSAAAPPDPALGWTQVMLQAGALGLLSYLLIWGGPRLFDKLDARFAAILAEQAAEREKDRMARHDVAAKFQQIIAAQYKECSDDRDRAREMQLRAIECLAGAVRAASGTKPQ